MNKITDKRKSSVKIKQSDHIYAVKIKTESNGLGVLKTLIIMLLIAAQLAVLILSYLYFATIFQWYFTFSIVMTLIAAIHVLSSDYHGQAKATWMLFLLISLGFGYVIYFMSDKRVFFAKNRKKFNKIIKQTQNLQTQINLEEVKNKEVKTTSNYLYNTGKFVASTTSRTTYFPSGASLFDEILDSISKANDFIFIEFFIISNGILLDRFLKVLKEKASLGVDVRIIYDDMGSHKTLKRKTKKEIIRSGIKLECFNRLVPVFNIALNLRDHRKIVIVDGKIGFTGGTNLADEYINEKRMHGYWKDEGIKIEGNAVNNLTLAFLEQWQFLTNTDVKCIEYINKAESFKSNGVVIPFVSGPNYPYSIAQNMFASIISSASEKLYIMTPYFIPDETITNLLINKARAGVDVRIILPDIADKKFVYIVSRNNAEKLMQHNIKIYTMTNSFVHSKVILTEHSAIIGSINMDLRSFNQQFESAVYTSETHTLKQVDDDFAFTLNHSKNLTEKDQKRKKVLFRMLAGLFNIISPFM